MDASVSFLLDNLKQVVVYHANLVSGAKDEFKELEKELQLMKTKLEDTAKRHKKEEAFKEWEKQIRDVVYEVEDTIDSCITQLASKSGIARTFGSSKISLAKEVKALREGSVKNVFDPARTHFATLTIGETSKAQQEIDDQVPDRFISKETKVKRIVGLEDETEILIKHLKETSDRLDVLSIIGMPGLGKTTFAYKVFHDPDISYEFPVRIWVTVSATLNKKDVFLSILKHFTQDEKYNKWDAAQLAQEVQEKLHIAKFLIVLDDVWTADAMNQIREALPMQNGMGKILITTRNKEVSKHAMNTREHHKLRFLKEDESWELLQYGIYDELHKFPKELEEVGIRIAKNCDGLPLSLVVIAGILNDKITTIVGDTCIVRDEWERIAKDVKNYLHAGDKKGTISKIIELSYSKLPYDLRDCFLYMGMFPEDYMIPVWQLTRLWVAEGFIQPKSGYSLEEIARDNLNDLISRALVIVQETKLNGEVKTCSVHDAIHEFCKKEAANPKNLFQEIRMNESEGVFDPSLDNIKGYRRISIHSYIRNLFSNKPDIPTRSFICFPKEPIILQTADIANVTKAFTLLRVFGAQKIKFPRFPSKMTELLHLRYLTLSLAFELKAIPDAIFTLWNLQTLIVETLSRTLEIKADMWKLMKLRHLKTKSSFVLSCKNVKGTGGENLKTLSRLAPESCTDVVCLKAKNLQTLGIHGDLSELLKSNCLEKLKRLNNLKLEHDAYPNVAAENPLTRLPDAKQFPTNLKILTLKGTYLGWDQMSTVGNLNALEVLKLKDHAFMGNSWQVGNSGFTKLEFLYIERTDLQFWKASHQSFPKLRNLTIKNCENLYEVPLDLKFTLKKLSLERVTTNAVKCGEDIEKFAKEKEKNVKIGGFKLVIGSGDKKSNS